MRVLPVIIFDLVLVILYPVSVYLFNYYESRAELRHKIGRILDTRIDILLNDMRIANCKRSELMLMVEDSCTNQTVLVMYLWYVKLIAKLRRTKFGGKYKCTKKQAIQPVTQRLPRRETTALEQSRYPVLSLDMPYRQ